MPRKPAHRAKPTRAQTSARQPARATVGLDASARASALEAEIEKCREQICAALQQRTGHDFRRYKDGTLLRRIKRRIQLCHAKSARDYLRLLKKDAREAELLLKDLLIGVTQFFRDPEEFRIIGEQILPRLLESKPAGGRLRIWVPGCSSGEEAYSLAMLVREQFDALDQRCSAQVFATDIDAKMLSRAREGRYPEAIAEHVSAARLERFFVHEPSTGSRRAGTYQASGELREMCVFSEHNLIRDPPFSSLDLISCRNVLIYLQGDLQKKLIPLFHFALLPSGYLFLGPSEGLPGHADLFKTVEMKYRIFQREDSAVRPVLDFPLSHRGASRNVAPAHAVTPSPHPVISGRVPAAAEGDEPLIAHLENELRTTRADLQSVVEELESANEELKSSNEELISTNEELQSSNEELQTSKEEIQSINDELQRNVSELERTETELRASEQRFLTLFREGPAPLGIVDAKTSRLIDVNDAWVATYGFTKEEAIGQTARELGIVPSDDERQRLLDNALRCHEGHVPEIILFGKGGKPLQVIVRSAAIELGGRPCFMSASIDITERKRAEQALRESEATLRGILDAAKESIWLFSLDGVTLLGNETALSRWEKPAETIIGRPFREIMPESLARSREARIQQAAKSGPVEFEDCRGDIQFEHRFYPVRGIDGKVDRVAAFSRDITERKRNEMQIRESEARYRRLVELAPDAVIVHEERRIVFANAAAVRLFGASGLEEVVGRDILDLVHPEDRGQSQKRIHVAQDGEQTPLSELRIMRLDGRPIFCEATGVGVEYQGKPAVQVIVRDITERKIQEGRLQKLSRLYAELSKVNETIVRTRDASELYREVCRIIAEDGQRPLVWIGLVEGRAVRPVAWSGPESDYIKTLRVEIDGEFGSGPSGTCIREGRAVVNDDFDSNPSTKPWREAARKHNLRASAAFPLRHQGTVIGSLTLYGSEPGTFDAEQVALLEALSADISFALDSMGKERALRESEQSLREADQRKNEFLAVLSHELRNPLAPVRNSLHILERSEPGSEQARRAKAVIDRQVGQMARLVDDLLDVTRITRGKIQIQCTPFELAGLLHRTAEDHRSQFTNSGVELDVCMIERPLWVNADAARIAQAVGNLLQNAAKFTGKGGRVSLSLDEDAASRMAVVRVRDNGIGIAPEVIARLFQPFIQADSSLDRSKGGLGLGLALVKGLAELHGGTVEAHSEGLGKGAEFTLRLPLHQEGTVRASSVAQPSASDGSRRVLIIEDNVDAADSLREVLEFCNHRVEVAYDGPSGISKARAFKPEVVLCDIGLPIMDGYAVARAFRADPVLRSVFMVALTGYALPEDLAKAQEAGFSDHLAKPPSLEKLERILARERLETGPSAAPLALGHRKDIV